MAVWHFDLQLMPDEIVPDAPACIDLAIVEDGLETFNWWLPHQPQCDYRQLIARTFATLDSWCSALLRWGSEDRVLVEAFMENAILEGIGIRVDMRSIDRESVAEIVHLATQLKCHLYVMETQQIVPPEVEALLPHLLRSRAVEFVCDPKRLIRRLSGENSK